mmetsp:Transcript_22789/g.63354  ORF Transcript_22789/g.63354 Transcript_22789/m.63354 type:complete len:228 (+) Transcript_22789:770-1453(+)
MLLRWFVVTLQIHRHGNVRHTSGNGKGHGEIIVLVILLLGVAVFWMLQVMMVMMVMILHVIIITIVAKKVVLVILRLFRMIRQKRGIIVDIISRRRFSLSRRNFNSPILFLFVVVVIIITIQGRHGLTGSRTRRAKQGGMCGNNGVSIRIVLFCMIPLLLRIRMLLLLLLLLMMAAVLFELLIRILELGQPGLDLPLLCGRGIHIIIVFRQRQGRYRTIADQIVRIS